MDLSNNQTQTLLEIALFIITTWLVNGYEQLSKPRWILSQPLRYWKVSRLMFKVLKKMCKFHSPKWPKDICLLGTTLKICAVFVTVPFCFSKKYLKPIYFYYLFSIIIHLQGIFQICQLAYIYFQKGEKSTVDINLTILDLVTYLFLIMACYLTVFRKKQDLEELLENFKKFNKYIDACSFEETERIYSSLWLYHLIPVCILINKCLINSSTTKSFPENFLSLLYILLLIYMKFLVMIIIILLAKIFVSRYNAFEEELKNIFRLLGVLIGARKFREINKLRKAFFLLQKSIEMVDDIFGLPIFAIILNASSGLLSSFSYTLLLETLPEMRSYWTVIHLFAEASVSWKNLLNLIYYNLIKLELNSQWLQPG